MLFRSTITDGQENQSREYNHARINQLVEQCKADGWTFVYVSADPSAYHDAAAMGYDHGSTTHFSASADGAARAMRSTARGLSNLRDKKRRGEIYNSAQFFEMGKDAEEDN